MAQLLFMKPFVMLRSIACPPDQVSGTSSLGAVLQQALHFILGFTLYLHWLGGSSWASTCYVGLQLGHVEYIVYTGKPTLQVQLIGTLTNTLKDFEWTHIALVQLPDSCQMQITCAQ